MALAKFDPVLVNTFKAEQPIAGNSVRVGQNWIKNSKNLDIPMRFLKATVEGMAIYMNNREKQSVSSRNIAEY